MNQRHRWAAFFEPTVVIPVGLLMAVSLFNLYSASQGGLAGTPYKGQALWFTVGLGVMVGVSLLDLRTLERYATLSYALLLVPLVLVHVLGHKAGGAQSWISLGPVNLQPSEPMKLGLLLALARFFGRTQKDPPFALVNLGWPLLLLALPLALIVKEPDLGTAIIYLALFGSLLLFVGISRKTLWGGIALGLVLVATIWLWKGDPLFFLKTYQKARLATFLNPEADPLGVGYHVIQSKIAIGSGGWWGHGYLKGLQTQFSFLPEQHTDFAFSVLAEEMGFVRSATVLLLFAFLIYAAFFVAAQARETFGCLVATGVGLLLFWHTAINVAMVLGLLPVIGVPLPFLSYGGSSVITIMAGIGLLLNVSRARHLF